MAQQQGHGELTQNVPDHQLIRDGSLTARSAFLPTSRRSSGERDSGVLPDVRAQRRLTRRGDRGEKSRHDDESLLFLVGAEERNDMFRPAAAYGGRHAAALIEEVPFLGPGVQKNRLGIAAEVQQGMDLAPVTLPRELRHRHQLDGGDPQVLQLARSGYDRLERALRREGAHVQFVDHHVLQRQGTPAGVGPQKSTVVYDFTTMLP